MLRSVFTKTISDHRRQAVAWAVGTGLLTAWLILLYPFIRDSEAMVELLEEMPPELMSAFGIDPATFTTGAGFLSGQMYSFIGPILAIGFAVGLGVAVTATEERDNTLDMLLSAPISRTHAIASKLLASLLLAAIVPTVMAIALVVLNDPIEMLLSVDGILSMNASLLMLGAFFATIAAAVGAFTGKPGTARGVALTAAILSWFVTAFEPFFDWLAIPSTLSPFTWYMDRNLFLDPWSGGIIWLTLLTLGFAGVATWLFSRRATGLRASLPC
jgi:ABC-2 type transport system permease protein